MSVLNATELYTLKWLKLVCCVCFATINKEGALRITRDFFLRKQRVIVQGGAMETVAQVLL